MCIVCNANGSGLDDAFLNAFTYSQREMKRAAELMLELSEHRLTNPNAKPAYRRTHKAMRRIMREWNKIEQQREQKTLNMINEDDLAYIKANTPLDQYVEFVNTRIANNGKWFIRNKLKNPGKDTT